LTAGRKQGRASNSRPVRSAK